MWGSERVNLTLREERGGASWPCILFPRSPWWPISKAVNGSELNNYHCPAVGGEKCAPAFALKIREKKERTRMGLIDYED